MRMEEDWKQVGFGWTNKHSPKLNLVSTKVSFLIPSQTITFSEFHQEFPEQSFYQLLLDHFPSFPYDFDTFKDIFHLFLHQYFTVEKPQYLSHYEDLRRHGGLSNERQLRWDIMYIPPNLSFNLHAHPNIEIIWVLSGTIHEYRLINTSKDFTQEYLQAREDKTSPSIKGPNLANVNDLQFVYNSVSAIPSVELTPSLSKERLRSAFIINEVGSIHLSFTREEETVLLVVWSGGHANVSKDEYPPDATHLFPLINNK